jgi:glutathione S-transferase
MLTLFHAPRTRSTRILALIAAMGIEDWVEVREVSVPRVDGTGRRDPANPHPEGKVPLLVHDGVAIWESAAIMLHLTDLFPDAGLGVPPGDPLRGRYLSWLSWYAGVMEPVMILDAAGLSHPYLEGSLRGLPEVRARLAAALAEAPWLVGGRYTAADLLVSSPFLWFEGLDPGPARVADWIARCGAHPARAKAEALDALALAA